MALAALHPCAVLDGPRPWAGACAGGDLPGRFHRPGPLRGGRASPAAAAPYSDAGVGAWASVGALGLGAAAIAVAAPRHQRALRQTPGRRGKQACAVLPDGTNEEGEDLQEPLNVKLGEVSDVVLYGNDFSPPCRKIQTMLRYYEVPFKTVSGRHPTSDYKKIPVLEMNGRQINDSHVIVKNLVPVLTGEPFAPSQLEWERRITFEFQPSIEVELFGNGSDFALAAGLDGWKAGLARLGAPVLGALIGSVFRSRYGDFPPSATFGKQFREACGEKPFFHGDSPGPVDLSLFGTYEDLASKGCETTEAFLSGSGLRPWHERMLEATRAGAGAAAAAAA